MDGVDTPQTVMTPGAPRVLETGKAYQMIICGCCLRMQKLPNGNLNRNLSLISPHIYSTVWFCLPTTDVTTFAKETVANSCLSLSQKVGALQS